MKFSEVHILVFLALKSIVQVLLLKISDSVYDMGKHQNLLDIHLVLKFYIIIVSQGRKKIERNCSNSSETRKHRTGQLNSLYVNKWEYLRWKSITKQNKKPCRKLYDQYFVLDFIKLRSLNSGFLRNLNLICCSSLESISCLSAVLQH